MLISIEGVDGAGKSTQAALLVEALRASGVDARLVHFPRYADPVHGLLISKFLRGELGPSDDVSPWLVGLMFAADRVAAADTLRKDVAGGSWLVIDRYLHSNLAFQGAKIPDEQERRQFQHWLWTYEVVQSHVPVPDLSVLLDLPTTQTERYLAGSAGRAGGRAYLKGAGDIHENDEALQGRVRDEYLTLFSRCEPNERVVDCMNASHVDRRHPAEIHEEVLRLVLTRAKTSDGPATPTMVGSH